MEVQNAATCRWDSQAEVHAGFRTLQQETLKMCGEFGLDKS